MRISGCGPPRTSASAGKRGKDIWSAGQGVSLSDEVRPSGAIVEDVVREYPGAVARLTG